MAAENTLPGTELLGSRLRVPEHVVYRDFVSETVVLNLETGRYHGLNPTGGQILDAVERSETVGEAAETLAVQYERPRDEVEADVLAFCSDLLTRGLVELRPDG
jgi:Coenzyme PQQ synthesis protein D (PqqD)